MTTKKINFEPRWTPRHLMFQCVVYATVCFCMLQNQSVLSQEVHSPIGVVDGYFGQTSTLVCDLRDIRDDYPILWYHHNRRLYLSFDEIIYSNVPPDIERRISVECERDVYQDICTLTIMGTTFEDGGNYECGYNRNGFIGRLSIGTLNVTYGDLPSGDSPICEIFVTVTTGHGYTPISDYSVGEDIILRCLVKDATVPPQLFWIRENKKLDESVHGFSLQRTVTLGNEDKGVEYTCVMLHPAVSEPRRCSIILQPKSPSTTAATTTTLTAATTSPPSSSLSPTTPHANGSSTKVTPTQFEFNLSTTSDKATASVVYPHSDASSSSKKQSFVLHVVAVVCGVILIAIVMIVVVLWQKRNKTSPIPTKLDYELTINRDSSITAEYAVVNAPDSIDKAHAHKSVNLIQKPMKHKSSQFRNSAAELGNAIADATDDSDHYENLSRQSKVTSTVDTPDEGLTYADLDLDTMTDSSIRLSTYHANEDTTVYADIQCTL